MQKTTKDSVTIGGLLRRQTRMKKYLILLTASLALTVSYGQTNLATQIPKLKPAIFLITTYDDDENELGLGTGFFIDSLGTGVSCYHVFEGATKAIVKLSNGKQYAVNNVITQSKQHDQLKFSILNEDHEKFKYLKIDYKKAVGENIFVIGNPLGLEYTVSNGIISALRDDPDFGKVIQMTAPISGGSSGSPLLNSKGHAIGIITYSYDQGQNLNFAVSLEELKNTLVVNSNKFPESDKPRGEDYYNAGQTFLDANNYDDAINNFKKAIEANPKYAEAYYSLGYTYDKKGDYVTACSYLDKAVTYKPEYNE